MIKKTLNGTDVLRQKTHKGVDKVMDKAESMGQSSKEAMHRLQEKTMAIKKNVDGYIQKNPERSVLFAAGAGVIVGIVLTAVLMRRRH